MIVPWSRRLITSVLVVLLALFFAYPLLRFLLLPLQGAGDGDWMKGLATALSNTLLLALAAAGLSAPLGAGIAWLLERRRSLLNHFVGAGLWLIFLAPSYLLTTGWQIVFRQPVLYHSLAATLFYSPVGIIGLLALKALPFSVFVVRPTWGSMGSELEEAMRVHALPFARRAWLIGRLALPAVAAGFVIAFIENIQEFGIPATLGAHLRMPILTYAIYEHLDTSPLDFTGAARLSWVLVILAVCGALLHLGLHRRHSAVLIHGRARQAAPPASKKGIRLVLLTIVTVLWGVGLLVPGIALVISASAAGSWTGDYHSLFNSTGFALIAASVCLLLSLMLVQASNRPGRRLAVGIELFTISNMAIPGLVLGAAYLMAFNTAWLPLYGTSFLLIIGYTAGYTPMLTRLLQSPVAQIDPQLSEAARLHALPWIARLLDIEAVLLAAPLLRGWLLAFGFVLFELPVSELLYPPGRTPLGVAIVRLNQTLAFHEAARLALSGLALTAAVVAVVTVMTYLLLPLGRRRVTA